MIEDNRSANIGDSADSSAIQTGDGNTATITNYYYYYREDTRVVSVESTDAADDNLTCPYRGLFHFGPDNAEYFFGREIFVEELFVATQTRNFIPLLGASGSGKSSVVLAGLVPKLEQEGHWLFTHFRPGSDPFHALALALVPLYTKKLDDTDKIIQARKLSKSLVDGEIPLGDVFAQIHQNNPTHRVLLIADQFEEIYTLCADQKVRHSFLDSLLGSFPSSSPQSQCDRVLIATMRADFLANALLYRPFGDVLKNDIKLSSMNHDELTSVISKPAEKLGVRFESGLVERILDDVEDEPGNLPLLEFALTQLWKQRQDKLLTHAGYQAIGKVQGALARHADENYSKLSATEKEKVRRIFIQLVQPGEGTQDTRRLATKAELGETSWGLVKKLADKRLVVTNQNAANQETVEVVHEALISNWDELRRWMNENRSFRAWQERLRMDMEQWQRMQQDKEQLLRGKVLAEAEEKLKTRRDELSKAEKEFIRASVMLRQRAKQRIYLSWGVLGSSFILALGFWGWLNYIPSGQLTQIRWRLNNVSGKVKNPEYQSKVAITFAKNENFEQAIRTTDKISNSRYKAQALSAIASIFAKLSQPEKTADLLQQAISSADKIKSSQYKAEVLRAIALVFAKLSQPEKAADLLQQAIKSADKIESSRYKAEALRAIASAITKLSQPEKAADLLQQAIKSADKIESSQHKAQVLSDIASVTTKFSQPEKATFLLQQAINSANKIKSSRYKAQALNAIVSVIAKLSQTEKATDLLQQAINSADKIEDVYFKAEALRAIAFTANPSQPEKAAYLLQQAINSADKIENFYPKAEALRAIALTANPSQPEKAAYLLQQAINSADKIKSFQYKAETLKAITSTITKLSQPEKAAVLLQHTINSADKIRSSKYKAEALSAIASVTFKLSQSKKATDLLQQVIDSANKIKSSEYKAEALSAIASVTFKLSQSEKATDLLQQVIDSANKIEDSYSKAQALRAIASTAKLAQPEKATDLLQQAINSADKIGDSKAQVLSAIVSVIVKLSQSEKAASLLEKTIASADNIFNPRDKAEVLKVIAKASAKHKNWGIALKATNECRGGEECEVQVLSEVLTVHGEQKNPELKEEE